MNYNNFFAELKRRNVYKVAITYAVVAWLLIQAASILLPTFEAPNWVMKAFIILLALGFIGIVFISWAFESTPEGLKRTEDVSPEEAAKLPSWSRKKFATFIGAVALIAIGLLVYQFLSPKRPVRTVATENEAVVPQKSIAVLPFESLSEDKANAYFAEGVQDEILTRLAKVADLKVISRTSTQHFKSAPDNLPQIAKQLGVMNILEGTVQKSNDQVRVNVQLINAMTDAHLWADIYDRKLTDIFAVESDIAKTIAETLQARLTGSEKSAMTKAPTANGAAYELYLKGKSLWGRRSGDNIPKAIAFYEQAVGRDPNYAPAYAGLAEAYVLLPYYTGARRRETIPKAREAISTALRLDPNLAEAHTANGKFLYGYEIDVAGALREHQRAIELQPNDATAHHWLGNDVLISLGRFDEAIAEGKRAIELDPLSPVINADLGITFYLARRYDDAIAQFNKTLEIDPTFFYTHYNLGIVRQLKGDLVGAISEFEKAKRLSDDPLVLSLCAAAKAYNGDKNAAQKALADLDKISQDRDIEGYCRALVYLSLNKKDEALHWLEQDYQDRNGSDIGWIKVDPLLDSLRGDSRFDVLIQKVTGEKK